MYYNIKKNIILVDFLIILQNVQFVRNDYHFMLVVQKTMNDIYYNFIVYIYNFIV